jgi:hypothetical protein
MIWKRARQASNATPRAAQNHESKIRNQKSEMEG